MSSRSAVVCDDDPLLRCVLARVIGPIGYEVCAEAESPSEALEVIDRVHADVVVLDLALRDGRGEDLLRHLVAERPETKVVVFSSHVVDHDALLDAGATAVVEKPDFPALEVVLGDLVHGGSLRQDLRRPVARAVPALDPPAALSLSGLEPWSSFRKAAESLLSGDAVLALDLIPSGTDAGNWDHVLRTDHRVALARCAASVRRDQDRVSLSPDGVPSCWRSPPTRRHPRRCSAGSGPCGPVRSTAGPPSASTGTCARACPPGRCSTTPSRPCCSTSRRRPTRCG